MNEEREFYLVYDQKQVRITKKVNDKKFYYNGLVKHILEEKLILIDKIVGQVIFAFDEIKNIELLPKQKEEDKHGTR